ncbi:MAG: hypothetical protein JJT94_14715 [Bernardetiaceae bacterium]|nr:hypothetical protein [Bernardetiaceae bacterium]
MNKRDIKSGMLFQIPLLKGLGYGAVKVVFSEDIYSHEHKHYWHTLLYAYLYKSDIDILSEEVSKIENSGLLLNPLLLSGLPRLRGENKVKLIGNGSLDDLFIPDYKNGRTLMKPRIENPHDIWWYHKKLRFDKHIDASYEKLKHLEAYLIMDYDLCVFRISIEWMRYLGMDVEDCLKSNNLDFFEKAVIYRMKNTPPYWEQPKEIKGRAME